MEGLGISSTLKYNEPDRCIICISKVNRKLGDDNDDCQGKRDGEKSAEEENVQKMASMSVLKSPEFLTTFNGVLEFLRQKTSVISEIFLESLTSKEAPTICNFCCEKIIAVGNLLKALTRQVEEIKTILEESRRKAGGSQSINITNEGQPEGKWPESTGSQAEQQSAVLPVVKIDPDTPTDMEFENEPLSLDGFDDDDSENGATEDEEENEDDLNMASDTDDDPDYIKSEEDDNVNDEYDEECSSDDEDSVTIENKLNLVSTGKDPLEIPASSSSPNPQNSDLSCYEEGCRWKFKFKCVARLLYHQKKYHPTPAQQQEKIDKLRKIESKKAKKLLPPPETFPCDLEGCNRKLSSTKSLFKHQKKCHLKLMIELGRVQEFPCSCGQSFTSYTARYTHQSKSQTTTHPEFRHKFDTFKEIRAILENGQICDLCDEPIKLSDIFEHLSSHVGAEYVVKCPNFEECGHMFTHSKWLHGRHFYSPKWKNCKKIALERKFDLSCETCGFSSNQRIRLPTHLTNEHERGTLEKKLKCPISDCGKMFAVRQSIYFHLHAHRYKRIATQVCKHCLGTIKIEEMEGHLKEEHGIEEVIGCGQCPFKFGGRDDMVEHLYEHRSAGILCDICPRSDKPFRFGRYKDFRVHYFGVHKLCPKKYKCEEGKCEGCFWRKEGLNRHVGEEHKEDGGTKKKNPRVSCDLCFGDVNFASEINLISHKIRVHGADPFCCEFCGKRFNAKDLYNKHVKEHEGMVSQKEWRCEVEGCGKIFNSNYKWKLHVEGGHGGVKQHVCEFCGKGYEFPSGLKLHRDRVHLRLKPWVCEECGQAFSCRTSFSRHKGKHGGGGEEIRFGCEICGQRFRGKKYLTRHLKRHEEEGAGFKPRGAVKKKKIRKGKKRKVDMSV